MPFVHALSELNELAAVGSYVLAEDDADGSWTTHYIFDSNSVETDQGGQLLLPEYAWDPGTSRVYFFRDSVTPNDLHYEVIDQTNGEITGAGETPYHGDYDDRAADPRPRPREMCCWVGRPLREDAADVGKARSAARRSMRSGTMRLVDVDSTGKVEIRRRRHARRAGELPAHRAAARHRLGRGDVSGAPRQWHDRVREAAAVLAIRTAT